MSPIESTWSFEEYREIIETISEGVVVIDEDSTIVLSNPAHEKLFGYGRNELLGQSLYLLNGLPEDKAQHLVNQGLHALKENGVWTGIWENVKKDGSHLFTSCHVTKLKLQNKKFLVIVQRDVTQNILADNDKDFLQKASEILSRSLEINENLKALADLSITYFCDSCILDELTPEGKLIRTVVSIADDNKREMLTNLHNRLPLKHSHEHPVFSTLITGKTSFSVDLSQRFSELQDKYGLEYVKDLEELKIEGAIVVRLKGVNSLLGTMSFVTLKNSPHKFSERHKALALQLAHRVSSSMENSQLYHHAQEAIRLRDEFLSIASHELKTPLTSLLLQNQMRRRNLKKSVEPLDPEHLTNMLSNDEKQLRKLNRLIDDMLDISRIRSNRLSIMKDEVEVKTFLDDIIGNFKPQFMAQGSDLRLTCPDEVILKFDAYRIEQVIVNLLTNALKYGLGEPVKIEVNLHPHKVSIKVCDKGPGIHPDDLERIFQRFERSQDHRHINGLGLGLFISREIVEQHDGTLFATSQPGEGSTFVMELPL